MLPSPKTKVKDSRAFAIMEEFPHPGPDAMPTKEQEGQDHSPIDRSTLFQPTFMSDWAKVKQAVSPVWQEVIGGPIEFEISFVPFAEKPVTWDYMEAIGVAVSFVQEGRAVIYYGEEDNDKLHYRTVFHELIHLWAFRQDKHPAGKAVGPRIKSLFLTLPEAPRREALDFLELFYPKMHESLNEVCLVAYSLEESATEALSLVLFEKFVKQYGLEISLFTDSFLDLFVCDDPWRYPLLIGALKVHDYDLLEAVNELWNKPASDLVRDLTAVMREPGVFEKFAQELAERLGKTYGTVVSFEGEPENKEAFVRFGDIASRFGGERWKVSRKLPQILNGRFFTSYKERFEDPQRFIHEMGKALEKERVAASATHLVSRFYNYLMTADQGTLLEEVRTDKFQNDLRFTLFLIEYLEREFPAQALAMSHVTHAIRDRALTLP